jgi:hypothetical protein
MITSATPSALFHTGETSWWQDAAKRQKMQWMETGKFKGDLPPVVMGLKNGKLISYVIAGNLDRDDGLLISSLVRRALGVDTLYVVMDGHVPIGAYKKEMEKLIDENKYQRGDMQKMCDEEGACEVDKISDCLVFTRVDDKGGISVGIHSYKYYGKGDGGQIQWTPENDFMMPILEKAQMSGAVNDSLLETMEMPLFVDDPTSIFFALQFGIVRMPKGRGEKINLFANRALQYLSDKDCEVHDLRSNPIQVG